MINTRTRGEQVAELDERLNSSMSDYDGMILSEREYIQNKGAEQGSEQAVANAGPLYDDVLNGAEASATAKTSGAPEQTAFPSSSGGMPELPSSQREGDYQHNQTVYTPPADIPSGNDDDVVARQIREAALKEADPKLREKLWDEYRKYKNQTKGH